MKNTSTLAANMRNAFIERKGATIGGGKFTPEELKDGAFALNAVPGLLEALRDIEVQPAGHPDSERGNSKVHYCLHKARGAIARCTA